MINKYLLSSLVCILFYTAQAHPSSKLPQYNIINDLSSLIKNIANKDIQDDILSLTGQWGVKLDPDSIGEKHNYFNSGHTTMPIQLPELLMKPAMELAQSVRIMVSSPADTNT